MPEGDSVFQTARMLHAALAGHEVTRFELRVPRAATADLTGETVHDVTPRGKHLLIHIGEYTLHSHLKMEGRWQVYRPGERWRAPAFQARAIVGVGDVDRRTDAVGFELAMVELLRTADEDRVVGHLGPDLLGPDWDPVVAAQNLAADPRPAHVALLDQRNLAGLGNEYANEVLFVRGILPTRPTTGIDAPALVDTASRMIRANRDRPIRTFTGDTRRGQGNWVYGRGGRPCRRCGTSIRRGELGADPTAERIAFWCPRCQR
ncbi:DNA-formamidopyrimidine glycosylase family protein [Microbacterium sp.]|uniref:DNA-formamidopyrimidine glycosylase family protein n=1 Tax=Microbacterium sp. TaxID=51671 RepID=UPI0039E69DBE